MQGPTEEKLTGKRRLFLEWMPEQVDSLLDIGCAFSHMLNFLGQRARHRFGVEYDPAKLREAAASRAQAKADQGLTYEADPERERLVAAIRAAAEGREVPGP